MTKTTLSKLFNSSIYRCNYKYSVIAINYLLNDFLLFMLG